MTVRPTRAAAPYSAASLDRVRQDDAILALARSTGLAADGQQVLEIAARAAAEALDADRCEILECARDGTLRLRAETTCTAHPPAPPLDAGAVEGALVRQIAAVIVARGGPFGLLRAHAPSGRTFRRPDLDFAQRVADLVAGELERRRSLIGDH